MLTHDDERPQGRAVCKCAVRMLLLCAGVLPVPLAAQDATFALMDTIPDDVFIVTASRPNPERQFLDDDWAEVWQAFENSGTAEDVLDLIISLSDEEHRSEITRIKDRFAGLLGAVEWTSLTSGEFAFGERLHPPVPILGGSAWIGPPDIVLLFRSDPEAARAGFEGIDAILRAAFSEIDGLAGTRFEFEELDLDGTSFLSLDLLQLVPDAPPMPISIGLHEDTLIATFGEEIRADVAGLLAGTSSKRAVSACPRFKAAFAALPEADDAIEFFDMNNLKEPLQSYARTIVHGIGAEIESRPRDDIVNSRQDDEANALSRFAIKAYERGDIEQALKLTEAAYEANPHDSLVLYNLACFHSLLGHADEALDWLDLAVESGFHAPNKIADDPDLAALHGNPRFEAALESARSEARAVPRGWLSAAETLADRFLESLGIIDYTATVHRTEGDATYSDSITVLAKDARDNPFYPVIAGSRPIDSFSKYLPVETVSYSVAGGADLRPLYTFLEQSIAETGPLGEKLLADWESIQQEWKLNVHDDLLGLLGGEVVQASFKLGAHKEWVWMAAVKDEQVASDLLASALETLPKHLAELAKENPMMAMLSIRSWPTQEEELQGFREVMFGMSQRKSLCGVHDSWLVLGSSPEAVLLTRATAAGEHPNVLQNEALMSAALLPDGPATMVTFADHRDDAAAAGTAIRSASIGGGMVAAAIPDPQAKMFVGRMFGILAGLAPVVEAIDFFDTTSSFTTFDGMAWHRNSVTHYLPQEPR